MAAQDLSWTLDHIRQHIEQGLPLVPLFNIDVIEASPERGAVRLRAGDYVTRPGGSVAGPVQFALADVATYALILAVWHDEAAVTVDMTINFLRPAMTLPLVAVATALRAGRRLFTAEVRITEEASGRLISHATTTYAITPLTTTPGATGLGATGLGATGLGAMEPGATTLGTTPPAATTLGATALGVMAPIGDDDVG